MVRFKNRYVLAEFQWQDGKYDPNLANKDIYDAVKDSVAYHFGDLGAGFINSGLSIKYWNAVTGLALVRVPREHIQELRVSLTFLTQLKSRQLKVKSLHCSGTIRGCERAAVDYLRDWLRNSSSALEAKRREFIGREVSEEFRAVQT
jgi:ribonuclease P/MRP protein subunit POP5